MALVALSDDDADLAATFDGSGYGPALVQPDEPRATGGTMPDWLAVWLLIICDNTMHLTINYAALRWL